jgi:O-antigen/teichoic acid export membrane protein
MNDQDISLAKKVFNNTVFGIVEVILSKVGNTVIFILLVRLLSGRDIAAIGIAMGYLVLLAYLDIMPIRVLLRDYPRIIEDLNKRDKLLTSLFLFLALQALAILLLCFTLQFFVLKELNIPGLCFLFFGMTIDFMSLMFQGWIRTILYADFQQFLATKISSIFLLIRLACYSLLLFNPSLDTYTYILVGTSIANCAMWGITFIKRFHFRPNFCADTLPILRRSLNSYGLWDHFNRMVIDTLFTIDTVVLSLFALGQLQDIGNYTIALKFTSLLFLIPMQLHLALQVTLSNFNDRKRHINAINVFIKLNCLISFAQLLFVFVAGNWLIRLLFGAGIHTDVIRYATIIAIGVTIMNLSWPLISIINNLCNLRQAFLSVFLPAFVFGGAIYVGSAMFWGAIGVAYGNVAIYTLLALGLAIFTAKKYPFPVKFHLISAEERGLLRELVKGRA